MGAVAQASESLGLWDSVAAIGPGHYAVLRDDEMASVAQQLSRGFVMDDVSSDLVRALYRNLLTLRLSRLYEMLPVSDGESRWMGIEGEPTEAGYVLTLMATAPKRGSAELGSMAGWLEMLPIEERYGTGTPYAIDQRIEIGTGGVGPRDVQRFFTCLLQALERAAELQPDLDEAHLLSAVTTTDHVQKEHFRKIGRQTRVYKVVSCPKLTQESEKHSENP